MSSSTYICQLDELPQNCNMHAVSSKVVIIDGSEQDGIESRCALEIYEEWWVVTEELHTMQTNSFIIGLCYCP